MNHTALKILKTVAKRGELTLATALGMARRRHKNHLDQYPLALLLEDGYLGITIKHTPPEGAEDMREFSLATTLHMFTLPRDANGVVNYRGVKSSGDINPAEVRIFLKAKGALYLDQQAEKFWERVWSFTLGFSAGLLVALASAWIRRELKLP
jgi:hypothetical protein